MAGLCRVSHNYIIIFIGIMHSASYLLSRLHTLTIQALFSLQYTPAQPTFPTHIPLAASSEGAAAEDGCLSNNPDTPTQTDSDGTCTPINSGSDKLELKVSSEEEESADGSHTGPSTPPLEDYHLPRHADMAGVHEVITTHSSKVKETDQTSSAKEAVKEGRGKGVELMEKLKELDLNSSSDDDEWDESLLPPR